MLLVSFKNIHIWPSYGQKMARMHIIGGIRFLAILGPLANWTEFFIGAQETIIYRLVIRNPSCDAYFSYFIFWATFCGKIGVAATCSLNGLGPPNPTKKLIHWVAFSANHYLEITFSKFSGVNSPPPS